MKSCRIVQITFLLLVLIFTAFLMVPGKANRTAQLPAVILAVSVLGIFHICSLVKQRERYRILIRNTSEIILSCDRNGRIKECLTGEYCGRSLFDIFPRTNRWEIGQALRTVSRMPSGKSIGLQMYSPGGETRYYSLTMENLQKDPFIRGISVTIRDVSEARKLESRLIRSRENAYKEARHDPLTSIPNRLYFTEDVTRRFARLKRHPEETVWLLMIDLDHFKDINDTWGHDVGDRVLIKLTELCGSLIRGSDVFARYGGEEFICSMDDLPPEAALEAAERMRKRVEEFTDWPEKIHLTISIGLAGYAGEEHPDELIKKSDIALYRAKALGRNRVCVYLAHEV